MTNIRAIKKIILWLSILVVTAGWPVSLIVSPPKIEKGFIFQLNNADEEKKILLQKLGLITSPLKKIFYNNKTTIISGRYAVNILSLVNFNNYFFAGNPQVDVTEVNHRMKFVYPAIAGFLVGVYLSIKKKKHVRLWIFTGITILILSIFKNADGIDFILFPAFALIIIDGMREIFKYKHGWLMLLVLTMLGLFEMGRIFI